MAAGYLITLPIGAAQYRRRAKHEERLDATDRGQIGTAPVET